MYNVMPEEGTRSHKDGCEHHVVAGIDLGPLEEQLSHLPSPRLYVFKGLSLKLFRFSFRKLKYYN